MKFNDVLNMYLETLNCSSKKLSKESGLSEPVISRYRSGERTPAKDSKQFKKLINALFNIAKESGKNNYSLNKITSDFEVAFENDSFDYETFSNNLNTLITSLKININEMAKYITFDPSHISRIRYGKSKPSNPIEFTNKICSYILFKYKSPDDLKKLEERLRSRFMWGLPVDIYPPDFELRCEIIKQKLKNTTLAHMINNDVIEYIANSCTNDVRHLEGTINRLMAYTAMIVPEKIDVEFANDALKDYLNKNIYSNNSIENIQKVVSDYYNITVDDLKGKKKSAKITFPRHVAMYLSRMLTDESFPRIGLEFGGRDHSTVIHSINKIDTELKTNMELKKAIDDIKNML